MPWAQGGGNGPFRGFAGPAAQARQVGRGARGVLLTRCQRHASLSRPGGAMSGLQLDPSRPARLDALQMLRAVAALLVVFSHVLDLEHKVWMGTGQDYPPGVPFGQLGVYAFFAVSGFIMYFTAGRQFGEPGAPAA